MSYVGNTPGVSSQRVVLEEVISGSPKSAFVPISGYIKGYVDVLVNGVEIDTADFTATDGITVNLATAAAVGDTVKIKAWLPRGLSDGYLKSEVDTLLAAIYTKSAADARYLQLAGGTLSGNLVLGSAASGNEAQLALGGYNASGGTGYHTFLSLKNSYGSATNPNKYFRLASNGALQIINSAYSSTIFNLSDTGVLSSVTMDANVLTSGQLAKPRLPSGSVLQVLQVVKLDTFSTTSAAPTFVDVTGLSISITPTSATSKILVAWSAHCSTSNTSGWYAAITKIQRNSTDIYVGNARGSETRASAQTGQASYHYSAHHGGKFLDSPNTTSPVTYKIQLCVEGGATATIGGSYNTSLPLDASVPSQITVMEIAA